MRLAPRFGTMGQPAALARLGRAVQASAPPVVPAIPLNVELSPDTGMATQSNFQSTSASYLSPGYRFATLSSPRFGLNVNNTQGIPLPSGTYRVTFTVANFVQHAASLFVRVGATGTSTPTGAVSATVASGTITGDGTYTVDIVVPSTTTGQGFNFQGSGSGCRWDFTFAGFQKIA